MITDADIKKMKKVFVTKDDLQAMEKRQDQKYASKDDLKAQTKEIITGVADYIADSLNPELEEHDRRLDRIDKELHINSLAG